MPKYIVDAPEVKKGEELSSGGIRAKGKLVAQYTNPTPYVEPKTQIVLIPVKEESSFSDEHPILSFFGEELADIGLELWESEIKPYLISKIKSKIQSLFNQRNPKQQVIVTTAKIEETVSDTPVITISKAG